MQLANKGGTTQSKTETSSPPAWALEALQTVGSEAPRLYREKQGYNVYTGPTQAPMSEPRLLGMNNLLAATGAGPRVGGGGLGLITNAGLQAQREAFKNQIFPQSAPGNNPQGKDGQRIAYTDPVTGRPYSHRDGTFYTLDGTRIVQANEFGQGFSADELSSGRDFKGNPIAGKPRMGGYPAGSGAGGAGAGVGMLPPSAGAGGGILPPRDSGGQAFGLWVPTTNSKRDSGK